VKHRFRCRCSRPIAVVMGLLVILSSLHAAPAEVEAAMYSRYIWRGFDLNPQNKRVFQPSLTFPVGNRGFSVNLWGSFSLADRDLDELDLTLSWRFSAGEDFYVTVGAVQYGWYFARDFTWKDHTSRELFITLEKDIRGFSPEFSLFWDFANGSGLYARLGISHTSELCCGTSLEISAALGYNHRQWIKGSGFSDLDLGISAPWRLYRVTITPTAHLCVILMDEINPGTKVEVWGGIAVNWDA